MPVLPAAFEAHPLWTSVDSLENSLDNAGDLMADDGTTDVLKLLPLIIADLKALRDVPSWRFVDTALLDQIQSQVDALTNQINSASAAAPDESQRTQLATSLGQAIDQINGRLNAAPRPVTGARDGKGLVTALRQMGELQDARAKTLAGDLDQLAEQVKLRKAELEKLETSIESAGTSATEHVQRLDAAVTRVTDEFSSQLVDWKQSYESQSEAIDKAAEELRASVEEAAANQRSSLESDAKSVLESLEDLREEATVVVGATAERTTAADFEDYADSQEVAARWWAIAAVCLGAAAVGMILYLVSRSHENSELLTALKAVGSLGLLGIMTFAARQVTFHRSEARDSRQIALSLKALGPFVATLPDAQQQDIRQRVALHVFGRPFGKTGQALPIRPSSEVPDQDEEAH